MWNIKTPALQDAQNEKSTAKQGVFLFEKI